MTLKITDISFRNFRSYTNFELHDISELTVFVGRNAIGKTNIIEGIQLLTALTSFRHATIDQLIKQQESQSFLSLKTQDQYRMLDIDLVLEGRTRKYKLNGKAKKTSDLKGLIPSVIFTPDDLELVKGSMSYRRHTLDVLGSQLNSNYYLITKDYEKIIRHKNKLLKEEATKPLIDSINELLITCGAQLHCYRVALFKKLLPYIKERYEQIAGQDEQFDTLFIPSWYRDTPQEEYLDKSQEIITREQAQFFLAEELEKHTKEEYARKQAVVGPHKDKIYFNINQTNASLFGSQGQQRSIVLAYKLAEAAVIEEMLGQKPVLLLDDVMSELDSQRRSALVGYISNDVQTFITTANLDYFDKSMLDLAHVVKLPLN